MIDKQFEEIFNINIEFYSYEKKLLSKNNKDINDDNDLYYYIVNHEWLKKFKEHICYDKFKAEMLNYNIKISDLKRNKKIKDKIKNIIASYIKTDFPSYLKEENFINAKKESANIKENGKVNRKEYYKFFHVLKASEFNSLYNFLNHKKKFILKKVIFENNNTDKIIIQNYFAQYEFCHYDEKENKYAYDFLLNFYDDKKDKYLNKLLCYKTLNNFFSSEKLQKQKISNNIYDLINNSGEKFGKIYFINEKLNHEDTINPCKKDENHKIKLFEDSCKTKDAKKMYKFLKKAVNKIAKVELAENIKFLKLLGGKIKSKKLLEKDNLQKIEINKLKDNYSKLEEENKNNNNIIKELKEEIQKLNQNNNIIKKLKEEIQKLNQNIKNKEMELENQKKMESQLVLNYEMQIEKIEKENKELKEENQNLKQNIQKDEDIQKMNENEIQNLKQNILNIQQQQNIEKKNQAILEMNQKKVFDQLYERKNNSKKIKIKRLKSFSSCLQTVKEEQKPLLMEAMFSKLLENFEKGSTSVGSISYMDSFLQCFSQTSSLNEYFKSPENKEIIVKGNFDNNQNKPRLSEVFYEVFQNESPLNNNRNKVIETFNEIFKNKEKIDTRDMVSSFLEQIHNEITNLKNPPELKDQNQNLDHYNREAILNHYINELEKSNKSFISDNFCTIIETTQKCQCCQGMNKPNNIYYSFSKQNCFVFPLEEIKNFRNNRLIQNMNMNNQMIVPNMDMGPMMMPNLGMSQENLNNRVHLSDCFEFNQKDELMNGDNQIFCNKCRQKSNSIIGNKIYFLSNTLIMILDRGKDNKCKIILDFPKEIDLSKYVIPSSNENGKYIYTIYGIITYIEGNNNGGSFIASYKSQIDGKWYRKNGSIIESITDYDKEIINCNSPYTLFYQRKYNENRNISI